MATSAKATIDDLHRVEGKADHSGDREPRVFRRGETADAEAAVPGWQFAVDELFE